MDGLVNGIEARDFLGGISPQTLYRIRKAGKLRPVMIGRRAMYRRSDLAQLVEQETVPTARGAAR